MSGERAAGGPHEVAAGCIAAARAAIGQARSTLLCARWRDAADPERLLAVAATYMRECNCSLDACDAGQRNILRQSVLGLRKEMAHLESLVNQGFLFYQGWTERLGAMQAGYTAAGSPAAPRFDARFRAEA
jgi:hypothetical protein